MFPFSPQGSTVSVSSSTSSGNVAIGNAGSLASRAIRVYNACSVAAFVNFGAGVSTAADTSTSVPVAPGAVEIFEVSTACNYAAVILASGTGTVYFTAGQGI